MKQSRTWNQALGPWPALFVFAVGFAVAYCVIRVLQSWIGSFLQPSTAKEVALIQAVLSICLVWSLLGLAVLILKMRKQTVYDIGWRKRANVRGWILAISIAIAYAWFVLLGPVGQYSQFLTDWSLYRISLALGVGISAGVCEETVFRGFVMKQVADAGLSPMFQVVISAVSFGAAHVGWGRLAGASGIAIALPAIFTMILGCALAIVYLVSRRSLGPVITAHMLIDIAIEPWLLLSFIASMAS